MMKHGGSIVDGAYTYHINPVKTLDIFTSKAMTARAAPTATQ
jgi:hypothetical protein